MVGGKAHGCIKEVTKAAKRCQSSLFSDLLLSKWIEGIYMNANMYVNCRDSPSSGVDAVYKAIYNL